MANIQSVKERLEITEQITRITELNNQVYRLRNDIAEVKEDSRTIKGLLFCLTLAILVDGALTTVLLFNRKK